MALLEQNKCIIQSLNNDGLGISKNNLGKIELPYVLPGEEVNFERHNYRGRTTYRLISVTTPSPSRVKAPCKYYGSCGGCLLQHMDEKSYQEFKINLIKRPLEEANLQPQFNDLIVMPAGQRRRAHLQVLKKDKNIFLGFHRFHSNQIINIDGCPAILPILSELIPNLKIALNNILEDKQKISLFLTQAYNGIDLVLEYTLRQNFTISQKKYLEEWAKQNNIIKISILYPGGTDILLLIQKPVILFGNKSVQIEANSFLQANHQSDQILVDLILAALPNSNKNTRVIDLFCGRGTFTLPLSKLYEVEGVEHDISALNALSKAITDEKIKLIKRNLFEKPISSNELATYNYAVINPPRAGAQAQAKELANSLIQKVIYISCNPRTFIEDAKILTANNYTLTELTPVDQFYWNPHLEIVGVFERKK